MLETYEDQEVPTLEKCLTGIKGLDEITCGGLPRGRATLLVGGPGAGKTLLGTHVVLSGVLEYDEPGVILSFDESVRELIQNLSTLRFPLNKMVAAERLFLEYIHVDMSGSKIVGNYNLDGLFIRLEHAVESVRAKRVVIDGLEALFSAFDNRALIRSELRRLFQWTKERGLTVLLTSEMGQIGLTRHGLEEYVADCVILLDHRVNEEISTRRLRVLKYRGSAHFDNEFPFRIDENGISVLPITSLSLDHSVSDERISSGIPGLDDMLGGKGFFRGTSILVAGTAGTGKTSIAAHFVNSACERGEKALFFSFEESQHQIIRNMLSIGIDFRKPTADGLLRIIASRPPSQELEGHLLVLLQSINEFRPTAVVIDPISNLTDVGSHAQVKAMWTRVVGECKAQGTTAFFTNLNSHSGSMDEIEARIASLMDTWLSLAEVESDGQCKITLKVRKSRGMFHSRRIKELVFSDKGLGLSDS